jgi:hypothetical protein
MDMDTDKLRNASIIGFTGKAGSGKSTAARWIVTNHKVARKISFAAPLKRMTYELVRNCIPQTWPHKAAECIDDPVLKEQPLPFLAGQTPRYIMQTLGTEWGRNTIHEDFWVMLVHSRIERILSSTFNAREGNRVNVVMDDVRFANEAAMIQSFGGVVVRIERPGAGKPDSVDAHASERMDFPVDGVLMNDGTAEDLHAKLRDLWPEPTLAPAKRKR